MNKCQQLVDKVSELIFLKVRERQINKFNRLLLKKEVPQVTGLIPRQAVPALFPLRQVVPRQSALFKPPRKFTIPRQSVLNPREIALFPPGRWLTGRQH